jgi:hypothetical protein
MKTLQQKIGILKNENKVAYRLIELMIKNGRIEKANEIADRAINKICKEEEAIDCSPKKYVLYKFGVEYKNGLYDFLYRKVEEGTTKEEAETKQFKSLLDNSLKGFGDEPIKVTLDEVLA